MGRKPPPDKDRCTEVTAAGTRCTYKAKKDGKCKRHQEGASTGRRWKGLEIIDPDNGTTVKDRILEALRAGAPKHHAAAAGGIGVSTLHEWIAKGVEWAEDPSAAPEDKRQYAEFAEATEKAIGNSVVASLALIQRAAQRGSWQAAAWLLERRFPKDFGKRTRIEPINSEGETLTYADLMASAKGEKSVGANHEQEG